MTPLSRPRDIPLPEFNVSTSVGQRRALFTKASAIVSVPPVIVLVEDHVDTREMYSDHLVFAGFDVVAAADAEGGYQLARRLLPSLVITDYRLPGPSGAELCNRLKQDERTAKIPTLLVTASSQRRDVERALTGGCAVVRLKPYLPDALERDVRALIAGDRVLSWPAEHQAHS